MNILLIIKPKVVLERKKKLKNNAEKQKKIVYVVKTRKLENVAILNLKLAKLE